LAIDVARAPTGNARGSVSAARATWRGAAHARVPQSGGRRLSPFSLTATSVLTRWTNV